MKLNKFISILIVLSVCLSAYGMDNLKEYQKFPENLNTHSALKNAIAKYIPHSLQEIENAQMENRFHFILNVIEPLMKCDGWKGEAKEITNIKVGKNDRIWKNTEDLKYNAIESRTQEKKIKKGEKPCLFLHRKKTSKPINFKIQGADELTQLELFKLIYFLLPIHTKCQTYANSMINLYSQWFKTHESSEFNSFEKVIDLPAIILSLGWKFLDDQTPKKIEERKKLFHEKNDVHFPTQFLKNVIDIHFRTDHYFNIFQKCSEQFTRLGEEKRNQLQNNTLPENEKKFTLEFINFLNKGVNFLNFSQNLLKEKLNINKIATFLQSDSEEKCSSLDSYKEEYQKLITMFKNRKTILEDLKKENKQQGKLILLKTNEDPYIQPHPKAQPKQTEEDKETRENNQKVLEKEQEKLKKKEDKKKNIQILMDEPQNVQDLVQKESNTETHTLFEMISSSKTMSELHEKLKNSEKSCGFNLEKLKGITAPKVNKKKKSVFSIRDNQKERFILWETIDGLQFKFLDDHNYKRIFG